MDHAGRKALIALKDLLDEIRARSGVEERRPGYFYFKGKALTHFHTDPTGLYADARLGKKWARLSVTKPEERIHFLRLLDKELNARANHSIEFGF